MDTKKTTLYIDKALYIKMKHYCVENEISMKDFMNNIIREKLK